MDYEAIFIHYEGKRRGKWYRMRCPYHDDANPSLDVDLQKSGFHCWGCGKTGNHVELIARLEHCSEARARLLIDKRISMQVSGKLGGMSSGRREPQKKYLNRNVLTDYFENVKDAPYTDYLRARGIYHNYNLLQVKADAMPAIRRCWEWRIVYPIWDYAGNLASIEGRTIINDAKRYLKYEGSRASLGLYGIDMIAGTQKCVFVVEGVFDALSVVQCGYPAVAMTCSELSDQQIRDLKKVADSIIVILDGVKPGTAKERARVEKNIGAKLSRHFAKNRYYVHTIGYVDTDLNELLLQGELKKYLKRVPWAGQK